MKITPIFSDSAAPALQPSGQDVFGPQLPGQGLARATGEVQGAAAQFQGAGVAAQFRGQQRNSQGAGATFSQFSGQAGSNQVAEGQIRRPSGASQGPGGQFRGQGRRQGGRGRQQG